MGSILLLALVGALLELDTTYAFQLTFSRGIVAGPLLGLLIGDVMTGLQIGIFTELLFVDFSPLGGMLPPSAVVCCAVSLMGCSLGIPAYFSFFFGVLGALFFSICEIYVRKQRASWVARQEQKIFKKPSYVTWAIVKALGLSFAMTFLFILIFGGAVSNVFVKVLPYLSEQLNIAGKFAYMAVPWIGLATLVSTFRLKAR